MNEKFDRRRKYYVVLDCETATLPYAKNLPENVKKQIAIAKPLIYDLGWTIVDKKGNVYARENYLISEIFSVPSIFNTAYYASKRPLYIDQLYSPNFHKWLEFQNECCDRIVNNTVIGNKKEFEPDVFRFRGKVYPLFDLWGLSCEYLLDNDEYKKACILNGWQTESGKYFKTSAETTYRFITGRLDFDEAHTAIDDADIESEIFALIVKRAKNKVEMGIEYFPFRILGTVERFLNLHPECQGF